MYAFRYHRINALLGNPLNSSISSSSLCGVEAIASDCVSFESLALSWPFANSMLCHKGMWSEFWRTKKSTNESTSYAAFQWLRMFSRSKTHQYASNLCDCWVIYDWRTLSDTAYICEWAWRLECRYRVKGVVVRSGSSTLCITTKLLKTHRFVVCALSCDGYSVFWLWTSLNKCRIRAWAGFLCFGDLEGYNWNTIQVIRNVDVNRKLTIMLITLVNSEAVMVDVRFRTVFAFINGLGAWIIGIGLEVKICIRPIHYNRQWNNHSKTHRFVSSAFPCDCYRLALPKTFSNTFRIRTGFLGFWGTKWVRMNLLVTLHLSLNV